jgi:hypothetical protein
MRIAAGTLVVLVLCTSAFAQTRYPALDREAACQTLMPAAAGGPLPANPDVLVLRFLGVSNYELAYRDNVILLDAGIDKLAWWAPNNITPEEMTMPTVSISGTRPRLARRPARSSSAIRSR